MLIPYHNWVYFYVIPLVCGIYPMAKLVEPAIIIALLQIFRSRIPTRTERKELKKGHS